MEKNQHTRKKGKAQEKKTGIAHSAPHQPLPAISGTSR